MEQKMGLILVLHVWLLLSAATAAQSGEAQTLLAFRDETTIAIGPVYSPLLWFTWNKTDENPCAWVGVDCAAGSDTVEGLDFSSWGVFPSTPALEVLSALKGLRRLDLSSNGLPFLQWTKLFVPIDEFSSPIVPIIFPDGIGLLTNLTHLDLSGNGYTGLIPDNISACQNLQELFLEDNLLEGGISAVTDITSLEILNVANNRFNSTFPILGEMPRLFYMDLSNNRFTGTLPALSNLPELRVLKLDNNNFTDLGDFFTSTKMIEELSVSGNQLSGNIPFNIGNIWNIQVLNLSDNQLSGPIPSKLGQNSNGSFILDLSQNKLSGSIPINLIGRPASDFVSVNISHNLLNGSITSILEELAGQEARYISLDLSYNQLSGAFHPRASTIIYNNSIITTFRINNNQLSGDIVDFLAEPPQEYLQFYVLEMHLQNNQFIGDMSRIVGALQLDAKWLATLQVLDMRNNNLRWSTSESVQDPLGLMLENLPEFLMEFRVGGNDFSGIPLPTTLTLNSSVETQNTFLEVLDLSNNNLTGGISDAVFIRSTLPSLRVIDLSNNEATGEIPPEIDSFQNLTDFNVSNNRLSGSISFIKPGSQLYNPSFFTGNARLCDGPLPPCNSGRSGLHLWVLLIIVGASTIMVLGSCLVAAWRWRVYNRRHEQDAELIRTLMEGTSTTLMSLWEMKKATNNFAESEEIGEGGFGKVYRGKLNDGTVVAIKRGNRDGFEKDKELFLNEVKILTQLNHRYLVKLLGCCMENKVAVLVLEFVPNGTLQEHLQRKCGAALLSWKQRLKIAVQTADALNYIHSTATVPIYHRDVKSANILLHDDLSAKVSDFGISKLVPVEVTHVSTKAIWGTIGYMDPEYYTSFKFTDRSDVYSFGVVLLELVSAKPAIDFRRCGEESSLVIFAKPHIESGDLEELIDPSLLETYLDPTGHGKESILSLGRLAMRCLNMRSTARPSMQDVWKELQNLQSLLELGVESVHLETMNEGGSEYPQQNFTDFLSPESSFSSTSSSTTENSARSIEMSQSSW